MVRTGQVKALASGGQVFYSDESLTKMSPKCKHMVLLYKGQVQNSDISNKV